MEFIEQPLPVEASHEEKLRVFYGSRLPIIADEDCRTREDVPNCHGLYHGVNVKICKCGGLSPAFDMLHNARELGMKTMVGCMIGTSVSVAPGLLLGQICNVVDLDAPIHLARDRAPTVVYDETGHVSNAPNVWGPSF